MKKSCQMLFVMLLAAMLVFSGCGKEDAPETTPAVSDPVVTTAPETTVPETTVPETTVPETTAPEATEQEVRAAALGVLDGDTYTNTYVGFGCQLDEGWEVLTSEQLQQLPDNLNELLSDTEVGEAMSSVPQIFDVQATNVQTMASFNVVYTEMTAAQRLSYLLMDDDAVLDSVLAQKDAMIEAYAQSGMVVSSIEKVPVTFLGQERVALRTQCTVGDVELYMIQLFNNSLLGKYSVATTFSGLSEQEVTELMNRFYPVG